MTVPGLPPVLFMRAPSGFRPALTNNEASVQGRVRQEDHRRLSASGGLGEGKGAVRCGWWYDGVMLRRRWASLGSRESNDLFEPSPKVRPLIAPHSREAADRKLTNVSLTIAELKKLL